MKNNPNNQLNRGRFNKGHIQHPPAPENKNENADHESLKENERHGATFPQNKEVNEGTAKQKND
jgi:hypothetical protein